MKKLLSFALVLMLCMSFAVPAYANTITGDLTTNNSETENVTATAIITNNKVYSIDITWGSMKWDYTIDKGTWDPETLSYSDGEAGVWTPEAAGDSDHVRIHNRSNAVINAALDWDATEAGAAVICDFKSSLTDGSSTYRNAAGEVLAQSTEGLASLDIARADSGDGHGNMQVGNFDVTVARTPSNVNLITTDTPIATITITITDVTPA